MVPPGYGPDIYKKNGLIEWKIIFQMNLLMRLDRFDLNLLVVFEAVYSESNLTRAGEQLNMAQPTISNAVARLRAVYGDPLFVRSGRGVAPTPLARQLIGPVRQALRQVQGTLAGTVAFEAESSERTFNLSIGEIQATSMLPPLIDVLSREAPDVRLRAFQTNRREIKDALATWAPWIWRSTFPGLSAHSLNQHQLTRGENVCVLRKGHPPCPWRHDAEEISGARLHCRFQPSDRFEPARAGAQSGRNAARSRCCGPSTTCRPCASWPRATTRWSHPGRWPSSSMCREASAVRDRHGRHPGSTGIAVPRRIPPITGCAH